jgi:hypothetical protein
VRRARRAQPRNRGAAHRPDNHKPLPATTLLVRELIDSRSVLYRELRDPLRAWEAYWIAWTARVETPDCVTVYLAPSRAQSDPGPCRRDGTPRRPLTAELSLGRVFSVLLVPQLMMAPMGFEPVFQPDHVFALSLNRFGLPTPRHMRRHQNTQPARSRQTDPSNDTGKNGATHWTTIIRHPTFLLLSPGIPPEATGRNARPRRPVCQKRNLVVTSHLTRAGHRLDDVRMAWPAAQTKGTLCPLCSMLPCSCTTSPSSVSVSPRHRS